MISYNVFSLFYDNFTKDVKYQKRAEYILSLFQKFDRKPTLLLDLACGTGNFAVEFSKRDIDVIGVDISEDMLAVAHDKNEQLARPVMYICQPAEELELFGTVDGAICMLDSLNHITDFENFKKAVCRTALFLEPERLFIFDLNTPYKHKSVLGNNSFKIRQGNTRCLWTNSYSEENNTVRINLEFSKKSGLFKKEFYSEEFFERTFSEDEISEVLDSAGLELVDVYGENSFESPKINSERNIYITRRKI